MYRYVVKITMVLIAFEIHAGDVVTVGTDMTCDLSPASMQSAVSQFDEVRITNQSTFDSFNVINTSAHIIGGYNNCTDAENNILSPIKTTISGRNTSTTIGINTTAAGGDLPQNVILENLNITDGMTSAPYIGAGITVLGNESVTIVNSVIENNIAPSFGGGVYVGGDGAALALQNVVIRNNVSGFRGGGIVVSQAAQVSLENSLIQSNQALLGGGISVFSSGSQLVVNDSEIAQNTASDSGGGISCANDVSISITGESAIHANQAQFGGGLAVTAECRLVSYSGDSQPVNAINFGIFNNSAVNFGGGIYVNNGGKLLLIGNQNHYANLTGNEVTMNNSRGGGIHLVGEDSYAHLINARISDNEAVAGGAISVNQGAHLQMRRSSGGCFGNQVCSLISENSALLSAAINLETCGTVSIYQTQISDNLANSAVVLNAEGNTNDVCHSVFEGNLIFGNYRLGGNPTLMMVLDRKASLEFAFNTITDNNADVIFSLRNTAGTVQDLNINGSIIWNVPAIPITETAANNYSGNCFSVHDNSSLPAGFGNIIQTIDPIFTDPMSEDYSTTKFSPFSDYCDTSLYQPRFHDIVGKVRGYAFVAPVLGHYDMGAFEYDDINTNNVIFQDTFD